MKISIDDTVCEKHGLTKDHILVLAAIQYGNSEIYDDLIREGYITEANSSMFETTKNYAATNKGIDVVSDVILESDTELEESHDSILDLANTLRSIYPGGKMPGTAYYYRGNTADIVKKLKSFFKRYGNKYSNEEIIAATQKYIESFNGNYVYLKLLKYFIWKDEKKDGETIQSSLLADYMENKDQVNHTNDDWSIELR